jgi:hypothetical protein
MQGKQVPSYRPRRWEASTSASAGVNKRSDFRSIGWIVFRSMASPAAPLFLITVLRSSFNSLFLLPFRCNFDRCKEVG